MTLDLKVLEWKPLISEGWLDRIEVKLTDKHSEYWRVVKLLRLLRNPREYAQIETALEIHRDFVLAATRRRRDARLVLLAVNSKRLGLIWCYGVAATSEDLEEARRIAEECFAALVAGFRGHYRQALVRPLTAEEGEEIDRIFMISGKSLVIKGIPEPRDSYTRPQSDLIGFRVGRRMVEMLEETVRALGDKEYAYVVLAEAMPPEKVKALLRKVADLATKYSDFTESAYVGFTFSIPIGFTLGRAYGEQIASAHSHGKAHTVTDGRAASGSSGESTASAQGVTVSESCSRSESVQHSLTMSQAHTHGRARTRTESEGMSESLAYTYGTAHSIAHTHGEGHTISHTVGRAESEGIQVTQGKAHTVSHSLTHSASHTEGLADTSGWSRTQNRSESAQESWSHGTTRTQSLQTSRSVQRSHVVARSQSITQGVTRSHTTGHTESWGTTRSSGSSWSSGGGYTWQRSVSEGTSRSETAGTSQTTGTSHSLSLSHGGFSNRTQGRSSTQGSSEGWQAGGGVYAGPPFVHGGGSLSHYGGTSRAETQSQSATQGENWQVGRQYGTQESTTQSRSTTLGTSRSVSESHGGSHHWSSGGFSSSGYTHQRGVSVSDGVARSRSVTMGRSVADGVTRSESVSRGRSISISHTTGGSRGWTVGESYGLTGSKTESASDTRGVSRSLSEADTASRSVGRSLTHTRSESWTEGRTVSRSTTVSDTVSKSLTKGRSVIRQVSEGVTESESVTNGEAVGLANTVGLVEGHAVSRQLSGSRSDSRQGGWSESRSIGDSVSNSETVSGGLSRSNSYAVIAGIWPGLSMGYSRQRIDEARRLLYEVIRIEEQRYVEMASHGGYYVMGVIIAPDEETIAMAEATILGAFAPTRLIPHPLKAVRGDSRILTAAKAFAFDLREAPSKSDLDPYLYLNVYTSTELAALTHPPRLEAPGLENVAENVPEFRVPPPSGYDIEFGYVISHEVGGLIGIRYGINKDELLHALFLGVTRMGKSNAAMLFIERAIKGLGGRALVLDWKKEWRRLLLDLPGRFYTLYTDSWHPLRWNPLRPPRGVDPETWRDVIAQWFSITYGLGHRSYSLLWDVLDKLYEEGGVYKAYHKGLTLAAFPTLEDLYFVIAERLEKLKQDKKVSFDTLDVYRRTLDRLEYYTRRRFRRLFCPKRGIDIGDLLSGTGVTVIEAGELADVHKPFLLGTLAIASFLYRKFNGPSERPEFIVIEEAHQIAFDVAKKDVARMLNVTENIFDKMAAESAGFNQYLVMIAQYPSVLGNGVLKNTGLLVSFKLIAETDDYPDVSMVTEMLARDSRLDHREVKRFLTRLPIGWSVVRKMRTSNLIDTEPVLVKWDVYPVPSPTDEELDAALKGSGPLRGDERGPEGN